MLKSKNLRHFELMLINNVVELKFFYLNFLFTYYSIFVSLQNKLK